MRWEVVLQVIFRDTFFLPFLAMVGSDRACPCTKHTQNTLQTSTLRSRRDGSRLRGGTDVTGRGCGASGQHGRPASDPHTHLASQAGTRLNYTKSFHQRIQGSGGIQNANVNSKAKCDDVTDRCHSVTVHGETDSARPAASWWSTTSKQQRLKWRNVPYGAAATTKQTPHLALDCTFDCDYWFKLLYYYYKCYLTILDRRFSDAQSPSCTFTKNVALTQGREDTGAHASFPPLHMRQWTTAIVFGVMVSINICISHKFTLIGNVKTK